MAEIADITHPDRRRGDAKFLDALIDWLDEPPGRGKIGFKRQPEIGRMLWVLSALHGSIAVSGLAHFLETHLIGGYFNEAQDWARQLGAGQTAIYLATAARAGPSGQVPRTDKERITLIKKLSLQAPGGDPFLEIDREYRDAVLNELPDRLRAFIRTHHSDVEAAFSAEPR